MYLIKPKVVGRLLPLLALCLSFNGQAQQKDNAISSAAYNKADNTPTSIAFTEDANWRMDQVQDVFGKYLGIKPGGNTDLRLKNTTTTKAGITTLRFDEYYKGIKVALGGYTVTGKAGRVSFMTGNFYAPGELSATPALTAANAFEKALTFVGASKYKWQNPGEEARIKKMYHNPDTSYLPKGKLVWVENRRTANKDHKLHLAWVFDIYASEPLSRQEVYIDAANGNVLFANQLIMHTAATGASRYSGVVPFQSSNTLGTFVLFDSTRGDGVYTMNMENGTDYSLATDYTSFLNTWPLLPADNVALDAHWGAEKVYDYFLTEHGRLSWDNMNGILLQFVHYGTDYNNAFWDGAEMTYGDGSGITTSGGFTPFTCIDVTGHEIGHGICQATAGLIYESESGALNESFSDCWGATVEHWSDPHEIDAMPKNPWDLGEEISTEPMRSMNAPLLQGQPNTYGGTNWFDVSTCFPDGFNDQCGVHTNSGLMNYWYYLLVNGGSGTNGIGNNYVVNSLGWTKAGIILYQSELTLSSVATYADMRDASINAANVLYGPCSPEAQSVTSAWYAVGVGPNFVVCAPQISFVTTSVHVTEASASTACPASRTLTIGLKPTGTVSGGNPVANILVAPTSNAVLGVDYTLSSTSVTFLAGDPSTKFITMTIFDNGAVNDNKHVDLAFTVTPMGTGAVVAPFNDSMTVFIDNNDSIPYAGSVIFPTLDAGIPVISDASTAFYGSERKARSQFILYANELAAAGVVPNVPITQIAFNVLTKSSTAPFIDYTVSMAATNATDLSSAFITAGMTQVYFGDYTTTTGINALDFNTGTFTWNGTSNVVVQLCFGANSFPFTENDKVAGVQQSLFTIGDYNKQNSGGGSGCTLGYNNSGRLVIRPVMRFKQTVPPSPIESTAGSTRIYNVRTGQEVYFYSSADTQVIAGVKAPDHDLGCVNATVSQQGIGVTPASFSAINRSRKEITITPTTNGSITTYDVTFYMTTAELAGISPSTLSLLKTSALTDASVSTANSQVLATSLITAGNYTGFRATVTGFGRFMLVDGPLCNKPPADIVAAGPTTFCLGGNVSLSTAASAGYVYQWKKDGVNIPGATLSTYIASLGGDYTVDVRQSICDSESTPVTIILDSAYAAPVSGTVTSLCAGQTTALTDATPGGIWTSSNTSVATVDPSGNVTGAGAGLATITYAVTNVCGTATATYNMNVNALPVVAPVSGVSTICNSTNTTMTDATPGGVWSSSAPAIAPVSGGLVTGTGAGTATISYTVTNGSGCSASATHLLTVNPTPAATTSPTGTYIICATTTGSINALPATAGFTYQWQDGGTDIPGATSTSFETGTDGTYRVRITNTFGCTGTSADVMQIASTTFTATPTVSVSSPGGLSICATTTPVTFNATPVYGGSAPVYEWTVNGVVTGGAGSSLAYVPANGDIVACQLTSSSPCAVPATATASVIVTVNTLVSPAVTIGSSPNDTVCTGDGATYTATPSFGGTAPVYAWTVNGISVGSGPSYTAPLAANGDIVVCTMTSNAPCASTATVSSTPLTMTVIPHVTTTVSVSAAPAVWSPGANMTFAAIAVNEGSAPTYQWFINTVPVTGATSATYTTNTLTSGQTVSCKITTSMLCAAPHIALSNGFVAKPVTGMEYVNGMHALSLVPNPNKGTFTISGDLGNSEDVTISVVNMLGQEIHRAFAKPTGSLLNKEVTLPASTAAGIYIVSVTAGQLHEVFRITVE